MGGGQRPSIAGTGTQKHPGSSGGLTGSFGPTMHKKKFSINVNNNPGSAAQSLDPSDQEEDQGNTNFYKDTQAVIKSQLKKRHKGIDEEKNLER